MAKIFISYRREDTESVANHLKSELEKHVGKGKVFLDSKDIPPGRDWSDVLQRSVLGSDCMLAVIGPKWLNIEDPQTKKRRLDNPDDVVRQEIRGALQNKRMLVVPVLVGDAPMPGQNDLPDELKQLTSRQNFELRQRRWEDDVRALAEELKLISRSPTFAKLRRTVELAAAFAFLLVVALAWKTADGPPPSPPQPDDQQIEGDTVKGKFLRETPPVVWMTVIGKDGTSKQTPLTLYGVNDVDPRIEARWLEKHPEELSCRVVSSSESSPVYRCLAANTFDLSEALLLNGGACALPDAPQSYQDAQRRATAAKRGTCNHSR